MAGLSNADFRKLLATPRPGATQGGQGEQGEKKQKKPKPQRPAKPRQADNEGEEGDGGPLYRDRAAERRKGLSANHEGVPADLAGLLEGSKGADLSTVSYEESKYLGGDVAHTHLVKGLDFALLQRVKADQAAAGGKEGSEDEEEGAARPGARGGPAFGKVLGGQAEVPKFKSALGRSVHAFFFERGRPGGRAAADVSQLFLPRRTAFVYDLEEGGDLPTTLRRSIEDCPKARLCASGRSPRPRRAVPARLPRAPPRAGVRAPPGSRPPPARSDPPASPPLPLPAAVHDTPGGGRKRLKKKEREALLTQHGLAVAGSLRPAQGQGGGGGGAAAAQEAGAGEQPEAGAAPRPVDDDEDIFGDAGRDYAPTLPPPPDGEAAGGGVAEQERRGGYFGGGGGDAPGADLPPLPGEAAGPDAGPARPPVGGFDADAAFGAYPDTDAAYAAADAAAAAAEARQEKAREAARGAAAAARGGGGLGGDDDAYAECYPDYGGGYDLAMGDSDEEGPADDGKARGEAVASSGVVPKTLEGRLKVRQQQRESQHQKSKLQSQLGKIAKIMEDKGYEHGDAFRRGGRRREGGGGGAAAAGEEGGGGMALPAKKRRI
eukprot:scaffold26.g3354.t1